MRKFQWTTWFMLLILAGCVEEPRVVYFTPETFKAAVATRIAGLPDMEIPIGSDNPMNAELVVNRNYVLRSPSRMTPEIVASLRECIDMSGDEWRRYRKLRACVVGGENSYTYVKSATLDAETCFHSKEGNCFALTNLFVGAARLANLDAYYMLVEDIISNRSDGQTVIHTNHIIAAIPVAHDRILVDFIPNPRQYRFTTILTDIEAAGLFYNNLAAGLLLEKREYEADHLFRIAQALFPDSYQIHNNIGVLKLRLGDLEAARSHFAKALSLARFPDLVLGNVLTTYERTGNLEAYEDIKAELETARKRNPFVYVSLAVRAYQRGEYLDALDLLEIARNIDRTIPDIYSLQMQIADAWGDQALKQKAYKNLIKYNSVSRQQVLEAAP